MTDIKTDVRPSGECLTFLNKLWGFVWYKLVHIFFRIGSQSSAFQIVPDISMHGCVVLGEMTWTRPGHSGLAVESFWGQAAGFHLDSARLRLDLNFFKAAFYLKVLYGATSERLECHYVRRRTLCYISNIGNRIIRIHFGNVRLICWNFKELMQILSLSTHSHADGKYNVVSYST